MQGPCAVCYMQQKSPAQCDAENAYLTLCNGCCLMFCELMGCNKAFYCFQLTNLRM